MSKEQLEYVENINRFFTFNQINRRIDLTRFAILNDRERDEVIKTERESISKIGIEHNTILSN
ncbi:MAG: hypothetical protein WCG95_00255 [bacterium]